MSSRFGGFTSRPDLVMTGASAVLLVGALLAGCCWAGGVPVELWPVEQGSPGERGVPGGQGSPGALGGPGRRSDSGGLGARLRCRLFRRSIFPSGVLTTYDLWVAALMTEAGCQ